MNQLLLQYAYLQVLDLLTTVAFLVNGIAEGNPIVRMALYTAPHPLEGLLAVKIIGVCLGLYCWKVGKLRLLSRMNVLFAAVVAWNLMALIMGTAIS